MDNYVPSEEEAEIDAPLPFPPPFNDASMKIMDVKKNTKFGHIIDHTIKYFEDETNRLVVFKGFGDGADKCISCVEVLKKRIKEHFYQWNMLNFGRKITYWDPIIDGLDRLRVTIDTPVMFILVSKDPFPVELQCLSMQSSNDRSCPFVEGDGTRTNNTPQTSKRGGLKKVNPQKWKKTDKRTPEGRRQLEAESSERHRIQKEVTMEERR